jgi:hypothetical protein
MQVHRANKVRPHESQPAARRSGKVVHGHKRNAFMFVDSTNSGESFAIARQCHSHERSNIVVVIVIFVRNFLPALLPRDGRLIPLVANQVGARFLLTMPPDAVKTTVLASSSNAKLDMRYCGKSLSIMTTSPLLAGTRFTQS